MLEVERCPDGGREEVHADTIIGGDGASSRVARAAGWAPLETVPLVQAIVPLPKDMAPDTVRVWFVPEDTPYFYWLIPESPTRGALGVIGESGSDTRRSLEQFLEKRKLDPIEFQGARIPCLQALGSGAAPGRPGLGVSGGRRGRAGESFDGRRHRHRISRRARRRRGDSERRREPRTAHFAPRTRPSPFACAARCMISSNPITAGSWILLNDVDRSNLSAHILATKL